MIITLGGKAMGRSEVMPIWGEQLSERQIDDVVAYLRTVLVSASK
jgi:cytochrome c oxidase cbb3-type subunit III